MCWMINLGFEPPTSLSAEILGLDRRQVMGCQKDKTPRTNTMYFRISEKHGTMLSFWSRIYKSTPGTKLNKTFNWFIWQVIWKICHESVFVIQFGNLQEVYGTHRIPCCTPCPQAKSLSLKITMNRTVQGIQLFFIDFGHKLSSENWTSLYTSSEFPFWH